MATPTTAASAALRAKGKTNVLQGIMVFLLLLLIVLHFIEISFGRGSFPADFASSSSSLGVSNNKNNNNNDLSSQTQSQASFVPLKNNNDDANANDNINFTLANQDSLGFFTGISNEQWLQRRKIARHRKVGRFPNYAGRSVNPRMLESAQTWYQQVSEQMNASMRECVQRRQQQQQVLYSSVHLLVHDCFLAA